MGLSAALYLRKGREYKIMRPIDTIRGKIDSDLTKYHSSSMCFIKSDADIKCIAGVGLCAMVTPLDKVTPVPYAQSDDSRSMKDEHSDSFPVLIVNRPDRWFESKMAARYMVLVLNTVSDRKGIGVGLLVPNTIINNPTVFRQIDSPSSVDSDGYPLQSMTREYIVGDE